LRSLAQAYLIYKQLTKMKLRSGKQWN